VLGAFTVGRGTAAQVLLAQGELLDLRVMLETARADYARAWARLEELTGRELSARAAAQAATQTATQTATQAATTEAPVVPTPTPAPGAPGAHSAADRGEEEAEHE